MHVEKRIAARFVNAIVIRDLAQGMSQILEGFVRTDSLGLPQRELYRHGTERIPGHIPYRISAFHGGSIGLAIICATRLC